MPELNELGTGDGQGNGIESGNGFGDGHESVFVKGSGCGGENGFGDGYNYGSIHLGTSSKSEGEGVLCQN